MKIRQQLRGTRVQKTVGASGGEEKNYRVQSISLELGELLPPRHHDRVPLQGFIRPVIQSAGAYIPHHESVTSSAAAPLCRWLASPALIRCLLKRQWLAVPKPECCVGGRGVADWWRLDAPGGGGDANVLRGPPGPRVTWC